MLVLGVNTVADACEAALVRDGAVVVAYAEPMNQGHDARLAPVVEILMQRAGVAFSALNRVAVVVGPGSFTGVRVGVAFARGLSLSLDIPAVGVTSLEAIEGVPREGRVLGLLSAKRRPPHRTWWGQVIAGGRGVIEPFEVAENELAGLMEAADVICGAIADLPDPGKPAIAGAPSASAAALFVSGLAQSDLPQPRPVYVREPDATPMKPIGQASS